jgi:hypothetical protein
MSHFHPVWSVGYNDVTDNYPSIFSHSYALPTWYNRMWLSDILTLVLKPQHYHPVVGLNKRFGWLQIVETIFWPCTCNCSLLVHDLLFMIQHTSDHRSSWHSICSPPSASSQPNGLGQLWAPLMFTNGTQLVRTGTPMVTITGLSSFHSLPLGVGSPVDNN